MRKVLFIFGVLNDSGIDWMARAGSRRGISRQDVLIDEGVPISSIVLLLQGRMGVSVAGIGEIAQLEAGDFVGEMSLIDGEPRSASIVVVEPTTMVVLTAEDFARLSEEVPRLSTKVLHEIARLISERLRQTSAALVDYIGGLLLE